MIRSLLALLAITFSFSPAIARSAPLDARVVWIKGARVYLAPVDSATLAIGDRLAFALGGKTLATGAGTHVADELAVATLTSGSLGRVKKLDRLRITSERATIQAPALLRVGFGSPRRARRFFACDSIAVRPPVAYRIEANTERGARLVSDHSPPAPWPDTLLVRLYDDATDEEIALERGDLDVAVFWPGELSSHAREDTRWSDAPSGSPAAADSLRCPVLARPSARRVVDALGADAIVRLLDCAVRKTAP